jgi:thiol-disulfide isomerase/thioredoxin
VGHNASGGNIVSNILPAGWTPQVHASRVLRAVLRVSVCVLAFLTLVNCGSISAAQDSHIQGAAQQQNGNSGEASCCVVTIPSKPKPGASSELDSKTLVPWNINFARSSAEALQGNKPILLEFWASWCEVCKVTDKEVFSDPQIAKIIGDKFVPVKVNFDANIAMDKLYGIKNLPTVVFTDSYGSELLRTLGLVKPDSFAKIVANFPSDMSRVNALDQALTTNRSDVNSLYAFAEEARRDHFYTLSNATYERALKLDRDAHRKELALASEGMNYLDLKDPQRAVTIFQRCLKDDSASTSKPLFMVGLGQAYAAAGEREIARTTLSEVIAQYPDTALAEKAKITLSELR